LAGVAVPEVASHLVVVVLRLNAVLRILRHRPVMMADLTTIFRSENNQQANYNKPGQGLWLARVFYQVA